MVAALDMGDAGDTAPAAAMALLIVVTCAGAKLLQLGLSRWLLRRAQAWRRR